jgi:hypothetical protein
MAELSSGYSIEMLGFKKVATLAVAGFVILGLEGFVILGLGFRWVMAKLSSVIL